MRCLESRLILKAAQLKHNTSHCLDCFKQEGINEDRIELNGWMPVRKPTWNCIKK